jgi:tRNA(fMet)-specific endonuclease VapC
MYVLDTDHLTLLERPDTAAAQRLQSRLGALGGDEEVVTTIVNYEEQTRGWFALMARARSITAQVNVYRRLNRHLENYRSWTVLPFDDAAAVELQRLRSFRLKVGPMDLKIAAVALSNRATLLKRNLVDFRQVPELQVEDWAT